MGPKRVMWVRRYQGQCRALRPLGHQGYRLRRHNKDQPLCSGYTISVDYLDLSYCTWELVIARDQDLCEAQSHILLFFVGNCAG